jgi:hypothetical protein
LRAQTLTVTFTKPANSLAETNIFVRSTTDVSAQSSRWWWLLDMARNFFDENPGVYLRMTTHGNELRLSKMKGDSIPV